MVPVWYNGTYSCTMISSWYDGTISTCTGPPYKPKHLPKNSQKQWAQMLSYLKKSGPKIAHCRSRCKFLPTMRIVRVNRQNQKSQPSTQCAPHSDTVVLTRESIDPVNPSELKINDLTTIKCKSKNNSENHDNCVFSVTKPISTAGYENNFF